MTITANAIATIIAIASQPSVATDSTTLAIDSTAIMTDTVVMNVHSPLTLTNDDYVRAADSLGVEVAAIRAIIDIETGARHIGFHAIGQPIVNYIPSTFASRAARRGIKVAAYRKSHPIAFSSLNARRYGSVQAAQHARLSVAMAIDSVAAIESTYWGMFQIGGFNWRQCGCKSPQEFAKRMSNSESSQLDLFVEFIKRSGMDKPLREHNWAKFARMYNGPSYARRGYHTRMARAYKKHLSK